MTADPRPDTARAPTGAAALTDPRHSPGVPPIGGPVGGCEPGTHRGRTRPPPPTPCLSWREVNRMWRPSLEELQRQLEEDSGCEAIDGCYVEPDGTCDHGQPSWLLALGLI